MPGEELLTTTDDLPWEFKDSTVIRKPRLLTHELFVKPVLPPPPPSLDWFRQDTWQGLFRIVPRPMPPTLSVFPEEEPVPSLDWFTPDNSLASYRTSPRRLTLDLQVGRLIPPAPPALDYFFQENSQFAFKNPPKRLTHEWFATQLIPPTTPTIDGWQFAAVLPFRRAVQILSGVLQMPEEEIAATVDGMGWDFVAPYIPRERLHVRPFTLEPPLDELVDQAVLLAWDYPDASTALFRVKGMALDNSPGIVSVVASAPVNMDWFYEDPVFAFVRRRVSAEARSAQFLTTFEQIVGNILMRLAVQIVDVLAASPLEISDVRRVDAEVTDRIIKRDAEVDDLVGRDAEVDDLTLGPLFI